MTRGARAFLAPGLQPLLASLGLLLAWEAAARSGLLPGMPDVLATARELPALLGDPDSLREIGASLRRMAIGYAVALLVSIPVGLAIGRSRVVERLLGPLLMMSYPVPKAALMPLIMLWVGVGEASKLLVIALGVGLPVIFHAADGARAVEEKIVWSARAMGMLAWRRLLFVVLPAAAPQIMVGCRTGLVLALITMVTSEMVARQAGAGNILFNALDMAQYETVYATILVISGLGVGLDLVFEAVRARLTGWAEDGPELAATAE